MIHIKMVERISGWNGNNVDNANENLLNICALWLFLLEVEQTSGDRKIILLYYMFCASYVTAG